MVRYKVDLIDKFVNDNQNDESIQAKKSKDMNKKIEQQIFDLLKEKNDKIELLETSNKNFKKENEELKRIANKFLQKLKGKK